MRIKGILKIGDLELNVDVDAPDKARSVYVTNIDPSSLVIPKHRLDVRYIGLSYPALDELRIKKIQYLGQLIRDDWTPKLDGLNPRTQAEIIDAISKFREMALIVGVDEPEQVLEKIPELTAASMRHKNIDKSTLVASQGLPEDVFGASTKPQEEPLKVVHSEGSQLDTGEEEMKNVKPISVGEVTLDSDVAVLNLRPKIEERLRKAELNTIGAIAILDMHELRQKLGDNYDYYKEIKDQMIALGYEIKPKPRAQNKLDLEHLKNQGLEPAVVQEKIPEDSDLSVLGLKDNLEAKLRVAGLNTIGDILNTLYRDLEFNILGKNWEQTKSVRDKMLAAGYDIRTRKPQEKTISSAPAKTVEN